MPKAKEGEAGCMYCNEVQPELTYCTGPNRWDIHPSHYLPICPVCIRTKHKECKESITRKLCNAPADCAVCSAYLDQNGLTETVNDFVRIAEVKIADRKTQFTDGLISWHEYLTAIEENATVSKQCIIDHISIHGR